VDGNSATAEDYHELSEQRTDQTKIFFVCFIVLVIMAVIGLFSLRSMQSIQANLIDIYTVRLPSIDYLIEADRDLQQLLIAERSLIFAEPGFAIHKQLLDDYQTNFGQSLDRWEKFKALSSAAEERAIIDTHDQARKQWEVSSRNVLDELGRSTDESRQRAIALSLGETSSTFEAMRDQLDKLTNMNLASAQAAGDAADSTYDTAMMLRPWSSRPPTPICGGDGRRRDEFNDLRNCRERRKSPRNFNGSGAAGA
jgi:methyl-accepting chemotaxis protein